MKSEPARDPGQQVAELDIADHIIAGRVEFNCEEPIKGGLILPSQVKCAYCAALVETPEAEHVFPESWYPTGTPPSQMLTVPSCRDCNGSLGAVEERLRRSMVMGLQWGNPAARGVQRAVFNSMNPHRAKGKTEPKRQREASIRENLWKKFRRAARFIPAAEHINSLPTSRPPAPYLAPNDAGLWMRGRGVISYEPADLEKVIKKFVRGVYYSQMKAPLASDVPIATPILRGDPWQVALDIIDRMNWHPQGVPPAFIYWGASLPGDTQSSLWIFLVWNEYVFCGITGKLSEEGAARTPID